MEEARITHALTDINSYSFQHTGAMVTLFLQDTSVHPPINAIITIGIIINTTINIIMDRVMGIMAGTIEIGNDTQRNTNRT